ncbi:MAG: hypothetical protein WCT53_00895 [Candidatus Gracilibacteria bacterium]
MVEFSANNQQLTAEEIHGPDCAFLDHLPAITPEEALVLVMRQAVGADVIEIVDVAQVLSPQGNLGQAMDGLNLISARLRSGSGLWGELNAKMIITAAYNLRDQRVRGRNGGSV